KSLRRWIFYPWTTAGGRELRWEADSGRQPEAAVPNRRASVHDLLELAGLVLRGHLLQRNRLDLRGLAGAAELLVARHADRLRGLQRGFQVLARIDLRFVLVEELAEGARHGEPDVGVDVPLAHAVLDAFLDFPHRHAVGLLHTPAVLADD